MEICMIGAGYVGLVTGVCFAEKGNNVWCVEADRKKVDTLKSGIAPIYEQGLDDMIARNIQAGRLHVTSDLQLGIEKAVLCFIAVGTPPGQDGSADLSYIFNAAREIGQYLNKYVVIVTKSTVPVGTAEMVRDIIKGELQVRGIENLEFDVVSNPEFLKEGTAVADFMFPDRIVIGSCTKRATEYMKQLYQPFIHSQSSILTMDIKSAELTKYAANAMLAARISFMNEMAQLCDKVGGDIDHIRVGIGSDSRIGSQFLCAGAGYGGSCFPKDVKELIYTGQKNGLEMNIADAVHKVNERQKYYLVDMIKKEFGNTLQGKKIAIWGLAFKAQTDDMREAPSMVIVEALSKMGANIVAYDPEAMEQAKQVFGECDYNIQYVSSMMEAAIHADALVLITDWQQFRKVDFSELKKRMKQPILFDGRNQFEPAEMAEYGFQYYCIGRNCYVK